MTDDQTKLVCPRCGFNAFLAQSRGEAEIALTCFMCGQSGAQAAPPIYEPLPEINELMEKSREWRQEFSHLLEDFTSEEVRKRFQEERDKYSYE